MNLSAEYLRLILNYNPETGVFMWLFSAGRVRAGDIAGSPNGRGYRSIGIDGHRYQEHRLAWVWMTGEWPKAGIDHVNRDPSDNRWCNLRDADKSKNRANGRAPSTNTSGFKGVYRYKQWRNWEAQIRVKGKKIYLGRFDTRHQAYAAYCIAARKHFGEYARLYDSETMIEPGPQSIGNDFLGI